MAQAQLQWTGISDFRPGIFHEVSPNNPPGAAVETDTYDCKSNRHGDLIAGPALGSEYLIDDLNGTEPAGDVDPGGLYYVTGLQIVNPVFDDNTLTGINQNNSELFVAFEYVTTADVRHLELQRLLRHGDETWEQIYDDTTASYVWATGHKPARATMGVTRSNSAAPLESGPSVLVVCQGDGVLKSFPDDTTPGTTSTVDLTVPVAPNPQPDMVAVHQGRVIAFPLTLTGFGDPGDLVVYAHNELMYWFEVNDVTTMDPLLSGNFYKVLFGYETPAGYDMAVSLSSNEFFLLKRYGGAVLVRGDLNRPQSINLPNVKSPGFAESWGVQCSLGFAYCVDNDGVWVWKGGDTSENLTPHLDSNFWRPSENPPYGPGTIYRAATKMALWGDLLVAPNNWYHDMTNAPEGGGGWWKLGIPEETQRIACHNDADWTGRWLYCTPWAILHGDTDPVVWEYDRNSQVGSYSWKSHPLKESIERQINVREVVVVLSGYGSVTVTLTGRTDDDLTGEQSDSTEEIWVQSDYPIAVRRNMSVKGGLMQVQIQSTNGSIDEDPVPNSIAPTVHEVRIGYVPRENIGKQESVVAVP